MNAQTQAVHKNRAQLIDLTRQLAPLGVLVVLVAAVGLLQPAALSNTGFQILLSQALPILLLALGQVVVLMVGGIDLSNAATAILGAVLVAKMLSPLGAFSPVVAIAATTGAGLLNGLVATYFQVPSFAVTLGALGAWQAVALILSGQSTVYISDNAGVLTWLVDYTMGGVTLDVVTGFLLTATLWGLLRWTRLGPSVRAIGFNERAAILSGLPVKTVKTAAFGLSGFFAGVAGVVLTAQQGTASASGLGIGLLLPAIAAAIVGGAAINGGVGNPFNVLVGALIIALIPVGSAAVGIDPHIQQIIYGVVIIIAVAAAVDRSRIGIIK